MRSPLPTLTAEEGAPCLFTPENTNDASLYALQPSPNSVCSAFTSISTRRADRTRPCILLLLFLFVLLLAVALSFFIGSFFSPITFESFLSNESSPYLIPSRVVNWTLQDVEVPQEEEEESPHFSQERIVRETLLVPLPQSLRPTHYQLHLDISKFPDKQLITGNVNITLESFGNSTDQEVIFHAGPEVKINRFRLRKQEKYVSVVTMKQELNKKMYRLLLKQPLQNSQYVLEIDFTTVICRQPGGGVNCHHELLKRSNESASRVTSFTTKFEPTLARSFMPCWDEPAIKATFQVSVRHDARLTVLSNTEPILSKKEEKVIARAKQHNRTKYIVTPFQKTPPMSIYLLSLVVGEFIKLEMQSQRKLAINLWTFPEDSARASFAAKLAPKLIDIHEEAFQMLYPLSKLDLVAARSFPVGAMENWGLVVFDRQSLLQPPDLDDSLNMTVDRHHHEYRIAKIICHEIAHQWFGNLVTLRDWNELWLNEGFASFFVYDFLSEKYPRLTQTEYYHRLAQLFTKQSGVERPALVRELRTESDVDAAFHSTHLYTKGCVLVRFIRDLLSDFDFRSGIRRYLRKNEFKAVTRSSLWAAMPAFADHGAEKERLEKVLEGWLLNQGIPQVTVIRNYNTNTIRVVQRPSQQNRYRIFLYDHKPPGNSTEEHNRYSFTDTPFSHEFEENMKRREKRDTAEGSTPFDDSLFQDLPLHYKLKLTEKKSRHRKKSIPRPTIEASAEQTQEEEELRVEKSLDGPSNQWSIPFTYLFGSVKSTEGQVMRQFWLHNKSVAFSDVELPAMTPLLANPDWAYPFRVNYDYSNWKMIARLLHDNHKEIPARSRMQLIIDSEFFLANSAHPHIYIYLLGYLQAESDLGVSLLGLDAVHRLIQSFQGSPIINPLLQYLKPVIRRLDEQLYESQADVEGASLWLLEAHRLTRLYQLRCAVDLPSCETQHSAREWLHMGLYARDMHQKTTALCHYLFTVGGEREIARIEAELRSSKVDPTMIHLAACVSRSPALSSLAAKLVVSQRNAAVYDSILRSDFSQQHYNREFRMNFWKSVSALSEEEKRFLFSVGETNPSPKSISLLHAVRTKEELHLVQSLLPSWGMVSVHLDFISRQLNWQEEVSRGVLLKFLTNPPLSL